MLKLLERRIAALDQHLVLLAPPGGAVPGAFSNVNVDASRHQRLVTEMQKLRGSVYLQDGAIERRHLSADGSHRTAEDARSWHLLMLNRERRVRACAWYLQHEPEVGLEQLRARRSPLASDPQWRRTLRSAVESEIARARAAGIHYSEVGGWAVAPECRCTSEGLVLALAAYSLGRLHGGTLGITTATVRHSSSTILRRLGGQPLEGDGRLVPSYFDPAYKCEMELLRFDSRRPSGKYVGLIEQLVQQLQFVPVIALDGATAPVRTSSYVSPEQAPALDLAVTAA